MNTINHRIRNISKCTVEELFAFVTVIMGYEGVSMPTRDLQGIESAIQSIQGETRETGIRIVDELKSRTWKARDLSKHRIADHAIGVQCTDICNTMCSDEEIEESSTVIKSIIGGPPCEN